MALAQEKAIQAKVSAKKLANSICSAVTFTGLITSYIFQVPKAVMRAEAPKTKRRASRTSRRVAHGAPALPVPGPEVLDRHVERGFGRGVRVGQLRVQR